MTALNPKNFQIWMKEMKNINKKSKVWNYVDPDGEDEESKDLKLSRYSNYEMKNQAVASAAASEEGRVIVPSFNKRPAKKYEELSDQQRKTYKMELTTFQMAEKINDRIAQDIRVVNAAIKTSVRTYIPPDRMESSVREILQFLFNKYKRSDDEIIEQLFEQLQQLKAPPTKSKVESWVAEWENMKNMIIERNMEDVFESETIFVKKFFKARRT